MTSEVPNKKSGPKFIGMEWLDEWLDEQRLTPEAAHEMLRTTFGERLAEWRKAHPTENSWVIPFHYKHEDAPSLDPLGALWIPSDGIQMVINSTGSIIHASATFEMEQELFPTGIGNASIFLPYPMDLTGNVPVASVNRYSLVASRLKEQVEKDFGVTVQPV